MALNTISIKQGKLVVPDKPIISFRAGVGIGHKKSNPGSLRSYGKC